jgi:RNA polymerase sigma-70 factor (ECF subfamily)
VRQRRYSTHDAEDLTQEFFARFLAKGSLGRVRREKGRFRSYMLSSFKYFLADMRDFRCRQKRGGEERPLSIDVQSGEGWYDLEPTDHVDPSTLFDHRWALVLLAKVLDRLRAEYERADRLPLFHCLKEFLIADKPPVSYADLALELNMSEGAIRVAVHRLRRRYGELFLREVANTVSDPNDISEEARHLLEALKISDAMGGVRSG